MRRIRLCIWLLFVGAVSCEYGWKPKQEYTFQLEGRSLNGLLSGDDQYAGIHYRGVLKVQAQSSSQLVMKLQNMTYTKIHEKMPEGWWNEVLKESYQDFPITRNPFSVKMDRGVVESLSVSKNLEDWEVNFLQGLVSQVQLDLTGTNAIHDSSSNIQHGKEKDEPVFRVMEDSVVGRCEVLYEVVKMSPALINTWEANDVELPKPEICGSKSYWEVTKTVNYNNCEMRAEYHHGLPSKKCEPGSNNCGDFWRRSSVTRSQGCGERKDMILLSSLRSSQILAYLHLHNESSAAVNSFLNISLISMKSSGSALNAPNQPQVIKNLFYRYSPSKGSESSMNIKSAPCDDANESSSLSESNKKHKSHKRIKREKSKKESSKSKKTPIRLKPSAVRKESSSAHSSGEDANWNLPQLNSDDAPYIPFSPFALARRGQAYGRINMGDRLKEIIGEIARAFETSKFIPEEMTMEKINLAIEVCRMMSLQELKQAVGSVMDNPDGASGQLTERKLYRDVMAMCGTTPSFQIIKSWIESKKLKGEAAAEILASLPAHLLTPTQDLVRRFYELTRSSAVLEDQQMKTSAVLSFSNLIRIACVNNDTRRSQYSSATFAGANCSSSDASKYIGWISQQLHADKPLRKVYIVALGNTGSSDALQPLKTIAHDSSSSPIERAMTVYAMKYQVFMNPKNMTSYLLSLFDDTGNPTSLRIAAASLLFYAKPPLEIWQRMAISTWYDPSLAVSAFVRSSLVSFAATQDPTYMELSTRASLALPLSKPFSPTLQKPLNMVQTSVWDQLQGVVMEQLSWLPGPDAVNLYYRNTQRLSGFTRINFDGEMWLTNPDSFLVILQELIYPNYDVTAARPMTKNLPRSTKWLRENLKISERSLPKLEGVFLLSLNKLKERMFTFDNKIAGELAKAGKKLVEQMKSGNQFHYQKADRSAMVVSTTTEMGLPVYMQINVPWAVRTSGEAKISKEDTELRLDASIMYTSELVACLKLFSAWDNTVHVSAWHASTHLELPPTRMQAQLDSSNMEFELAFSTMDHSSSSRVAHYSSRAFTVQTEAQMVKPISMADSALIIRHQEQPQMNISLMANAHLVVRGAMLHSQAMWKPVSVMGFPMLSTGVEEFSVDLLVELPPVTLTFNLGRAVVENGNINITLTPGGRNQSMNNEESSRESNSETSTTEASTTTDAYTTEAGQSPEIINSTYTTESSVNISTTTEGRREKKTEEMVQVFSARMEQNPSIFRAANIDPFANQDNESSYKYILTEVLKGMNSGRAYVVGMSVRVHTEEPTSYSAYSTFAGDIMKKHVRYGLFFRNESDNSRMAFTSIADMPSAPILDLEEIMNTSVQARILTDYSLKTESKNLQMTLEVTGRQSEKKLESIRNSKQYKRCAQQNDNVEPACRQMADKAGYLDRYNISLQYNDGIKYASLETVSSSYSMMKSLLFPYYGGSWAEQDSSDSENSAWVVMEMTPDMQHVNLLMKTYREGVEFNNVPITPLMANMLKYNPENSMQRGIVSPGYCGLSQNKVVTYDEVQFGYNITDCWHVMTKDASGKSRFVVLARKKDQQLEVEVNLDNYKVINLKSGPEFSVDQKSISVDKNEVLIVRDRVGTLLVRTYRGSDDSVRMILPAHGLELAYNNHTLLIQAGEGTRGRLAGVCGDNNRQRVGEFRNPSDRLEKTPFAFASSYLVKDGDCKEMPRSNKN